MNRNIARTSGREKNETAMRETIHGAQETLTEQNTRLPMAAPFQFLHQARRVDFNAPQHRAVSKQEDVNMDGHFQWQ